MRTICWTQNNKSKEDGFQVTSGQSEAVFKDTEFGTADRETEFRPEGQVPEEISGNGIDDDGDGLIDNQDLDCTTDPL